MQKDLYLRHVIGSILISSSALVLASCMPDEESNNKKADIGHTSAQVAQYAQAFSHYSSRSMNAVVNSELWQAKMLPEGRLVLSAPALNSLDLGGAEAYLESAYCVIAGTPRHLTWFETADDNGDLFLKGLGKDRAGMTATKLRQMIAKENFGIARGGTIELVSGGTLTPGGGCNNLNIPAGSAVAIVPIPEPVNVAETQEEYVMRALSCASGQEGNILQRVMATYMPSGTIVVGGSTFTNEAAVMANNGLAWEKLADNCLAPTQQITRTASDTTANALSVANLITIPGEIAVTLEKNLTDKDCVEVTKGTSGEGGGTDPSDVDKHYTTCASPTDITPLQGIEMDKDTLVKTETEIIPATCGGDPESETAITINVKGEKFKGVSEVLHRTPATLALSAFSGDVAYKKITRFYEIVRDFGDGNSDSEYTTIVTYKGQSLKCDRDDELTVACADIIGRGGEVLSDIPLVYQRVSSIHGWKDAVNLVPADLSHADWAQTQMNCKRRADEQFNCPAGMTHARKGKKSRIIEALSPDNIQYRAWQTDVTAKCQSPDDRRAVVRAMDPQKYEDVIASYGYNYTVGNNGYGLGCNASKNENHLTLNTVIDVFNDYHFYNHASNRVGKEIATEPTNTVPVSFESGRRKVGFTSLDTWQNDCTQAINAQLTQLGFAGFNADLDKKGSSGGVAKYSSGSVTGGINMSRSSCFAGDTPILMMDGTIKPISALRVGDMTAAGRVNQTYAREFDPNDRMSDTARDVYRGGLYSYHGVHVTGNHVVQENGRWIEVADSAEATPVNREITTVYNLDAENFVIPVIEASGDIAWFADNLNNIGGASARGIYRVSTDKPLAA